MAIIAHFQKAVLLVTASKLTDLSVYDNQGKPNNFDAEKFQKIKQHFIAFTQTYWFAEITPQEQGIELFEMWRSELKLQAMYDETRQQVHDIVEFINTSEAIKLNKIILFVTTCGILLAIAGLGAAFLGMNIFNSESEINILGISFLDGIVSHAIPVTLILGFTFFITFWLKYIKQN